MRDLNLLGLNVRDRVTGLTGVVTSISYDLYGRIMALVNPGTDKDGKPKEQHWFDTKRLAVESETPVMPAPNFSDVPGSENHPPLHQV